MYYENNYNDLMIFLKKMKNVRLAVKSFIIKDNKLLLLKRADNNPHLPENWEPPGGRLELGEDHFEGLERETKEEVNLDIEIGHPLTVRHFVREDQQTVTLINFLCKLKSNQLILSDEHSDYGGVEVNDSLTQYNSWYEPEFSRLLKLHKDF